MRRRGPHRHCRSDHVTSRAVSRRPQSPILGSRAPYRSAPATAFQELPRNVVRELQRRGCTVPQSPFTKKPHNVIKSEFAKRGQTDWAVLCSIKGTSSILVFWNGSEKKPAEIAPLEDRNFLQEITPGQIGFSRGISAIGKDYIVRFNDSDRGPQQPPIDHQGIDDAFIGKAS